MMGATKHTWPREQLDYIEKHYGTMSAEELARKVSKVPCHIPRTVASVRTIATKLGVTDPSMGGPKRVAPAEVPRVGVTTHRLK